MGGLEIQKVRRMRLTNMPFTDTFYLSTLEPITKITPQNVETCEINNSDSNVVTFPPILFWSKLEKGKEVINQ